ncbi:hypothetical protein ARMGADRAFT_591521 [Armillaria gallica]|uniref:Uncharacterized protein n=1 Tax=Armillaria gallica TaxID=47427 RepID=A0A2H3CPV8_ARMGA|nr:hypothetical protein ARMGADRAFT_591521 [Armillaria gallica]
MKISGNSDAAAEQRNRYHSATTLRRSSDEVMPLLNLRQGETYICTDHPTGRHTKQGDGGHHHQTIARNTNKVTGDADTEHSVAQDTVWVKKQHACKGTRTYDCNKTQVSETARKQACVSYRNGTPVAASEPMTAKERRSRGTANNQADDLANATCLVQYESL